MSYLFSFIFVLDFDVTQRPHLCSLLILKIVFFFSIENDVKLNQVINDTALAYFLPFL